MKTLKLPLFLGVALMGVMGISIAASAPIINRTNCLCKFDFTNTHGTTTCQPSSSSSATVWLYSPPNNYTSLAYAQTGKAPIFQDGGPTIEVFDSSKTFPSSLGGVNPGTTYAVVTFSPAPTINFAIYPSSWITASCQYVGR